MGILVHLVFIQIKHITTGEGGACLTNDSELIKKINYYKNLCFENPRFVHKDIGWNYRISNMQAAIGLAQIERLEFRIQRKREIGILYNHFLESSDSIQLQPKSLNYADNIWWVFGILIKKSLKMNAKEFMKKLNDLGIGSRPFFYQSTNNQSTNILNHLKILNILFQKIYL